MMQIYDGKFTNVFAHNLCIIMYVNMIRLKRITFNAELHKNNATT